MAHKPFFKKKEVVSEVAVEERPKIVTWGAAWLGDMKDSDLPYLSVKIGEEDLHSICEYYENSGEEYVSIMMFPNRNPREGMNDPDYYLLPPRKRDK